MQWKETLYWQGLPSGRGWDFFLMMSPVSSDEIKSQGTAPVHLIVFLFTTSRMTLDLTLIPACRKGLIND